MIDKNSPGYKKYEEILNKQHARAMLRLGLAVPIKVYTDDHDYNSREIIKALRKQHTK